MIFALKFSVENGYNRLLALSSANNISEVKNLIHSSRSDFERAQFLFVPFSWIPLEIVDTVGRATEGGRAVATALDSIAENFPDSDKNFSLTTKVNDENSA